MLSPPSRSGTKLGLLTFCVFAKLLIASPQTNVVFILADDLGITDIGAYASHFNRIESDELYFETPHLDRLTRDGIAFSASPFPHRLFRIAFSQSYANQLCSPTRAAILTGRIASGLGVTTATPNTRTYYNQNLTPPGDYDPHDVLEHKDPIKGKLPWINATTNTSIDPTTPTWPRILSSHDCAFLGKWHLGGHGAPDRQPAAFGFEEIAFFDAGGSPYFNWQQLWDRKKPHFKTMPNGFRVGSSGKPSGKDYLTEDLSAQAIRFIQQRKNKKRPFVLYYCPFAVHTPFQAPKDGIRHFDEKSQKGNLGRTNATYASMVERLEHLRFKLSRIGQA